ncbi:DUF6274 family protein [Streptomyces sp. NPDC047017]|uniref:DUF6274 family protein n=1 Tax=Streptomyces sp. NPDC047017 TaxID=3155024 RepID=UPI0033CB5A9B
MAASAPASASAGHRTRALLRAHLAAASSYRHLTRHCPVCHRLLRLTMDSAPLEAPGDVPDARETPRTPEAALDPLREPDPLPDALRGEPSSMA